MEACQSQESKQVASCIWIYYLLITTSTNLLMTFICQSSRHETESPCSVFHLHRTMIRALSWRSYLRDKTQLMDGGSRAEGTVAPPGLLCSLAWCQPRVCGVQQHVPVGTKPKQQQVFPLCLHFLTGVAGRLPPERSQEQPNTTR